VGRGALERLRAARSLCQHWVHLLRESASGLVTCVRVSTVSNVGDLLTKALDTSTFRRLRDRVLVPAVNYSVTHLLSRKTEA
jgi:hypothetical protein